MKQLYEKIRETEPGSYAAKLGDALYNFGAPTKELTDAISAARAYLEKLAIEELAKQVEPWARDVLAAQAKKKNER